LLSLTPDHLFLAAFRLSCDFWLLCHGYLFNMSQELLSPLDSSISERAVPHAGAIVHVRQRLYVVEEVVPAHSAGESSLAHLSCIEDDAQGQVLDIL
jgi:hypothetical protein